MTEPSILVTRRWPDQVEDTLRARFPSVRLNRDDVPLTASELTAALHEVDVVLPTVCDSLPAQMFEGRLRTRFLGNFGVGYNHIDIAAAARAGVVVTNTPGVLTDATADTAMTLLLMVARRAGEGERELRAGNWSGWRPTHLLGGDVTGRTLGVLGVGRIGSAVARRARYGFDMPVVYYDANPIEPAGLGLPDARRAESVEEVLQSADFVSLHMPGGGTNAHLIDARRLAMMKPDAYLINTARGDIVDSDALVKALANGSIAGAGLDVYENEPQVSEELRSLANVVLLPHLGSATRQTRVAMGQLALQNLECFLAGEEPPCRVA